MKGKEDEGAKQSTNRHLIQLRSRARRRTHKKGRLGKDRGRERKELEKGERHGRNLSRDGLVSVGRVALRKAM